MLSLADHVHNICKACFIQMRDLRRFRQYLTNAATVLEANALVSSHLDYFNSLSRSLSSFHMCKQQHIQNTLGRIVTNCNRYRLVIFSKNSIGCQLNFAVFSKQPLWFMSFFTVVTQTISALICLSVEECRAQDTTAQIRSSLRFLNSTHPYK